MKTSTKILVAYGVVLVAVQSIFLVNALVRYSHLKPLGKQMCEELARTPVHHFEADISQARYEPDTRRWEGRDMAVWIETPPAYRRFYFGANLETSCLSNDTLYVRALNDDLSWRPSYIPEIRTADIIMQDENGRRAVSHLKYGGGVE